MDCDNELGTLDPGKYIIVVAPQWNESASIACAFKSVLVGVHGPLENVALLKRVGRKIGCTAMSHVFSGMSEEKENLTNLETVHDEERKVI